MKKAKLFDDGDNQVLILPTGFHFEGNEVYIRRNPLTDEVILSEKRSWQSWDEFLAGQDPSAVPENFLQPREQPPT